MPRADDRRASWQPVRCARCGTAVQVAKFSPQHTSVQWTAAAAASCAEFGGARAAAPCGTASTPRWRPGCSPSARRGMSKSGSVRDYYQVPVAEVIRETDEASSLVLDVPPVPSGQTGSVARCYSLCTSALAGDLPAITVKRTAGGYASNWLLDHVTAGTVLDLLPPAGTFCPRSLDGDFLLFAAGSGSTPIMSILKSVLAAGRGRVALVYANRDEQSVIFTSELRKIAAAAGGRLVVMHWLDSLQGTPTTAGIAALAEPYATWQPYICGPDPYLTVVRAALAQLGVPARRIRAERFLSLAENPFEQTQATGGVAATLTVDLDGAARVLPWPAGSRMLDVLVGAG